ncbi:hypothetical protein ROHU_011673 [Labeo rohita]|uniref:Uncharacterized protein n=1 Tax=Labeo rohita TaxID=84645 RepID=A0A498LR85_LABRO|nr:hypothetical protein ROHU_011673 [Labeo rohita]
MRLCLSSYNLSISMPTLSLLALHSPRGPKGSQWTLTLAPEASLASGGSREGTGAERCGVHSSNQLNS